MEFNIDRKFFFDQLSTVARAISPFSPLPALSGILIDVQPDRIILTGSDSNIAIRSVITPGELNRLEIVSTGTISVESRFLLDIVRKLDSKDVRFALVDHTLVRLTNENGCYNINSSPADEYPPVDFSRPEGSFTLKPEEFQNIVAQTAFACSDKDQRPVLNGVNFQAKGSKLYCTGTDAYRLARKTTNLDSDQDFDITISAKSLNEVVKSLNSSMDKLEVYADHRKVQFIFDKTIFQSRLLDGSFPNISAIIPKTSIAELDVNTAELSRAIERTNFMRNENVHLVQFDCSDKGVRLKVRANEIGNSDELLMDAKWTGDPLTVTLNGSYVLDALKALRGERTTFKFSGTLKPILMSDGKDENTIMVVVPVRTHTM